jgi:hypothetical protein
MTAARPWETVTGGARPWETAQPLYDRIVSIRRPVKPAAVGALGYSGLLPANETVIFTGLPASIQFQPKRDRPLGGVPSDASSTADWRIFLPVGIAAAAGQIVERDVVADDLGRRFQIYGAWPTSLGWMISAMLLEA